MDASLAEKTQLAIAGRVLELQRGMVDMAETIGDKLKKALPTLRIRNASDFVAMTELQRKMLNMPEHVRLDVHDFSSEIKRAEAMASERLHRNKKGKKS